MREEAIKPSEVKKQIKPESQNTKKAELNFKPARTYLS
jgi:hypothetical protein